MTLLHTVRHPNRLFCKGLILRIFPTDANTAELTTLHERALILAVEPLPPNLCAVAYVPRPKKTTQTPPDADDSTHSKTTPDTDSDTAPNAPTDHPVVLDSNPSEQSLQAIHRADTTDFDHGFTKPAPAQPQAALPDDDSDASSDSAPNEQPLPSAALQSDDSSVD